jgi:hypothetical protein
MYAHILRTAGNIILQETRSSMMAKVVIDKLKAVVDKLSRTVLAIIGKSSPRHVAVIGLSTIDQGGHHRLV